jgi:excisionase family DNA binding protein
MDDFSPKPPFTLADMVLLTGKTRKTVCKLVEQGELPGYRHRGVRGYTFPYNWVMDWLHGRWTPKTATGATAVRELPEPTDFLKHRKAS